MSSYLGVERRRSNLKTARDNKNLTSRSICVDLSFAERYLPAKRLTMDGPLFN